ncbi:ClpP/crotonase [Sparassis latifolia]|uniref:ClpP/crotonase n=1 Tax=Sparassis crispa TaxID=139825 RepID=A0A401H1D9_9APHY|nr:ClpP/crotonase [Sparassis crispa]GBE88245.1 ClpP/crotonase [Sparassis crispa]
MSYPVRLPATRSVVTVTHPTPAIWIIELHNGADSRLTEEFITTALMPSLDVVEKHWREAFRAVRQTEDKKGAEGALIIVGNRSQHKFFSNGLDFAAVNSNPVSTATFFPHVFNPMVRRVLTFPIPVVAALNGHTFAAGMALALCCDYRVMTDGSSRNAWLCMNEVHFGSGWPLTLAAIMRAKVSDPRVLRKVALEGHRFTPQEALQAGLVDHIVKGDTDAVLAKAQEVAESVRSCPTFGAWGVIKRDLYRDVVEASLRDVAGHSVAVEDALAKARL